MNIICGTDFSPASRNAADVAAAFARKTGDRVVLVHAIEDETPGGADPGSSKHRVSARLAGEAQRPAASGTALRTMLESGHADAVLVRLVQETQTRLVVLASRGEHGGPISRLGSVAEQKLLFLGAGEAGTGIAELFVAALQAAGVSAAEARRRCWFVDSKGLVVQSRHAELAEHKQPYAHEHPYLATLSEAIESLKPTALIGVSGMPQTFTHGIVAAVARLNARPIIFALSNPTSKAECTAEQAYTWSEGRAIFASGSPFDPVQLNGSRFVRGQGNNIYIFPGVGMGALAAEAREVTDGMFLAAARTLAGIVSQDDLALGRVYPALTQIRDVSRQIATAIATVAHDSGLAGVPRPADIGADIASRMFTPAYRTYV